MRAGEVLPCGDTDPAMSRRCGARRRSALERGAAAGPGARRFRPGGGEPVTTAADPAITTPGARRGRRRIPSDPRLPGPARPAPTDRWDGSGRRPGSGPGAAMDVPMVPGRRRVAGPAAPRDRGTPEGRRHPAMAKQGVASPRHGFMAWPSPASRHLCRDRGFRFDDHFIMFEYGRWIFKGGLYICMLHCMCRFPESCQMLLPMLRRCGRFLRCERAVSALEYAVLAGVVITGVGAAIWAFSGNIATAITSLGTEIEGAADDVDVDLAKPSGG